MKRNPLLVTALMFVLGSMLLAAEPVVEKPFNGTNLDGWKFNGKSENCWEVGNLKADETTMELLPLRLPPESVVLFSSPPRRREARVMTWRVQRLDSRQRGNDGILLPSKSPKASEKGCLINLVDADWNQANPRKGVDIYTVEKFGDCTVKLEFLITKKSNSGVYLMGEYEVQISDSFGKPNDKLGQGDMGAIYSAAVPSTNASREAGTWQKFEIEFVAPKFDTEGNKTANGLFKKVVLNGKVVQKNVEVEKPTGGGLTMKEAPTGPLMLQGNHGPIAFRNIEIFVNKQ